MGAVPDESPSGLQVARALSHPLRRRLFYEFHREETSPSRAARRLDEPLNVVSYHTRVLLEQHCIRLVRSRRVRGAVERFYRATTDPIIEDAEWVELPAKLRRAMTLTTLSMVLSEARHGAVNGGFDAGTTHMSRTPLDLDRTGREELNRLLRAVMDDAIRIQSESLARDRETTSPVELVMLHFGRVSAP
jgi:DNA-binding transcriptional ArsR family regulator